MKEERTTCRARSGMELTAWEMRRFAAAYPWMPGMQTVPYRRLLAAGLVAEFFCDASTGEFTLTLARLDRYPSDYECNRARAAFRVPLVRTEAQAPFMFDGLYACRFFWKKRTRR